MIDNKSISIFFYRIRGCAILSVAYAHSLSLSDFAFRQLSALLGIIGVPLFLIASGYYFRKQTYKEFYRNKIINIVTLWLIWGSIAYLISFVAIGGEVSILNYIQYLLGCGTWLYYVPIYLIITLTFNSINNKSFLIVSIVISFFSCILTYFSILELNFITPYQNPLNWIGFYSLGILLKSMPIEKWSKNSMKIILLISLSIVLLSLFIIYIGAKVCYWNPICFIFELLCFVLIANVCSRLKDFSLLEKYGKFSFLIYFLHMQFGIFTVNRILSFVRTPEIVLFFLKPLLVIIVTYIYVILITYFIRLIGLQKINRYLGIPVK